MLDIAAACLVITALFSWFNYRFVRLPTTIGVMAIALLVSLLIVGLESAGLSQVLRRYEESLVQSIDFSDVLMQGMLALLLFAGALHVDLGDLKAQWWSVAGLALVGTLLSTLLVGFLLWYALTLMTLPLSLGYCLVFGALISPTDPIAVVGIMKSAGAPKKLELVIAGESLFNDGVGVVIFAVLVGMLASGAPPSVGTAGTMLLREAGGGIVFGLALGFLTYALLKSVDNYQVEVLLTLAAVTGGYALASRFHVSGPLAMVVTGLIVGNYGRANAMSEVTLRYVDMFWELLDEILNAVLFVLIGMEVLLISLSPTLLLAGGAAIVVTLLARWLSVGLPMGALGARLGLPAGSWRVLTWGGLRGGISVALALSLPAGPERDTILTLTYCVVVSSILVQGLTIGRVVRASMRHAG
jgi:Na+:H+ antiporter